jgi:hypothetical protein
MMWIEVTTLAFIASVAVQIPTWIAVSALAWVAALWLH